MPQLSSNNPMYKPASYQKASGLIPLGRIETQGKRYRFLCWLLKASKKKRR